jgi:hypothetical protein
MREVFTFTVNLIAVVRVRAADENVARQVVPTVLGAPGTAEIGLAKQNNVLTGRDATVSSVVRAAFAPGAGDGILAGIARADERR